MSSPVIQRWHAYVDSGDPALLEALLDPACMFHSPVLYRPMEGAAISMHYLRAAREVMVAMNFRYLREIVVEQQAVLEFLAEQDGMEINGVDLIRWTDAGRIIDFKVMVRPLTGVQTLQAAMARQLGLR